MKFGKYLDAEAVPEWRPRYVNYRAAKKLLKLVAVDVALAVPAAGPSPAQQPDTPRFRGSIGYTFVVVGGGNRNNDDDQLDQHAELVYFLIPEPTDKRAPRDRKSRAQSSDLRPTAPLASSALVPPPAPPHVPVIPTSPLDLATLVSPHPIPEPHVTSPVSQTTLPHATTTITNSSAIHAIASIQPTTPPPLPLQTSAQHFNHDSTATAVTANSPIAITTGSAIDPKPNPTTTIEEVDPFVDAKDPELAYKLAMSRKLTANQRAAMDASFNAESFAQSLPLGSTLFESEIRFFSYLDTQRFKVINFFESQMQVNRKKLQTLEQQVNMFMLYKSKVPFEANALRRKQKDFYIKNVFRVGGSANSGSTTKREQSPKTSELSGPDVGSNNSIANVALNLRRRFPFRGSTITGKNNTKKADLTVSTATATRPMDDDENASSPSLPLPTEIIASSSVGDRTKMPSPSLIKVGNSPMSPTSEKVKLRKADRRQLEYALTEFYRGLEILKNYKILNHTAFIKILKKYDRTANVNSGMYTYNLTPDRFCSTDELDEMMQKVETFYINAFASGKRHLGMKRLREITKRQTDFSRTIFWVGMFLGMSLSCFVATVPIAHSNWDNISYSYELLLVFSAFYTAIIFVLLFGVNLYVWSQCNINYRFIFETDSSLSMAYQELFFIASLLLLITSICTLFAFLNPFVSWGWSPQIWPVVLVLILAFIIGNPFPIFSRPSRYWFLDCMRCLVISPFSKVEFSYFFLGDELVSNVYSFSMMYLFACGYANHWNDIKAACNTQKSWWVAGLTSLPPYFRMMQCLRRYYDTRMLDPHILNMIKYLLQLVTTFISFSYKNSNNTVALAIWIVVGTATAVYATAWDYKKDWGLLQPGSKNKWLRDELMYPWRWYYYFAIITNFPLRMFWIFTVSYGDFKMSTNVHLVVLISAFLEVFRRIQWNLFRLENEQCNNCGMFRAIKDVPLPFDIPVRYNAYDEEFVDADDMNDDDLPEKTSKLGKNNSRSMTPIGFVSRESQKLKSVAQSVLASARNSVTFSPSAKQSVVLSPNRIYSRSSNAVNGMDSNISPTQQENAPTNDNLEMRNFRMNTIGKGNQAQGGDLESKGARRTNSSGRLSLISSASVKRNSSTGDWKAHRDYESGRTYTDYMENIHNVAIDHIVDNDSNDSIHGDGSDEEDGLAVVGEENEDYLTMRPVELPTAVEDDSPPEVEYSVDDNIVQNDGDDRVEWHETT